MKRIIAVIVCMMFFMSTGVLADAKLPEELINQPLNYTAAYNVSVVMDDNSDIRGLIREFVTEDVYDVFGNELLGNITNLITALLDYKGNVKIEADISEDFRKAKFSMVAEESLNSVVSANLNYTVNSKSGLWADIDLSNPEAYKMDVIFLLPTEDKYYYFNAGLFLDSTMVEEFYAALNIEQAKKTSDDFALVLTDYMTLEKTETGYKSVITNKNFIDFVNYIIAYSSNTTLDSTPVIVPDNLKILGDLGIQSEYTVKDGKLTQESMIMDIGIDISNIFTTFSGEEWGYTHSGKINATIAVNTEYSNYDSTEVSYPWITETSGICLNSMIEEELKPQNQDTYYEDYQTDYPWGWVSSYDQGFVSANGEYYVPLRAVLEDAYDDTVIISYDNGNITINCEHFDKFTWLGIIVGSDKVYVDGTEKYIGETLLVDGVTYVNTKLFTDIFGWNLISVSHELIDNTYNFNFTTGNY